MTLGWNMTTEIKIYFCSLLYSVLTEVLGSIVQLCVSYHFFYRGATALVGQGLLIEEDS